MPETYRGIPHLLDTWLVLIAMTLPVAISSAQRLGGVVPRLASLLMPASFALILAATLSLTAHRLTGVGVCGTHLTTTGGLTSMQGLLNVLLFVPRPGCRRLPADALPTGSRPGSGCPLPSRRCRR
ncbi:hypothetical protein F1D05_20690 [Kribbella qitaiheensis]|uniref:Uncharacterized protein n=1 Tax=Kribbella qitaiheensis TaxID=1544730 RepID=A0A7G6X0W9_9ACTN|nr:hypothetical protein [Kribbella qitaiheensis]QNE19884.1 hypothetical protein F1D05_20690 [Kribbella qitaiheensis]